jgi:hypothetical protein
MADDPKTKKNPQEPSGGRHEDPAEGDEETVDESIKEHERKHDGNS